MSYFNYHGKIQNKIREKKLIDYEIVDDWNGISPALILYFSDSKPMPIREDHWEEYMRLINETYSD